MIFGSPLIEQPEIDEVVATLKSGWIGTGPKVKKFEEDFGAYKKVKHALAVNSCTAALHLAMRVIGLKKGDEVIIPTMTFAATANAVIHAGGTPVFADCRRDTMNIDPKDIERKITKKTKAIIPVHFAGRPCDMDAIMAIAKKYNLKVIEDCAHAIESEYHGKKTGTFGDVGCFSFYVTKNVVTGEGGMAITNNDAYAAKIKTLTLHGMSKDAWKRFGDEGYQHYQVTNPGYKYNMTDIQASLGIHQLKRIDQNWNRREEIWNRYNEAFKNLPVFTPAPVEKNTRHAYHLYNFLLDLDKLDITRDRFLDEMTKRNIGIGVHYIAVHLQPRYRYNARNESCWRGIARNIMAYLNPLYQKEFSYKKGDFPNAEWISERTVSIPLSPKLSDQDVNDVIGAVKEILDNNRK